jgi:hypothetical protein
MNPRQLKGLNSVLLNGLSFLRRYISQIFRWISSPNLAGWNNGVFLNYSACGNDAVALDFTALSNGGPHANQAVIFDYAALDKSVGPNKNIIANLHVF